MRNRGMKKLKIKKNKKQLINGGAVYEGEDFRYGTCRA